MDELSPTVPHFGQLSKSLASMPPNRFLSMPTELIAQLLTDWLQWKDVVRTDSAASKERLCLHLSQSFEPNNQI